MNRRGRGRATSFSSSLSSNRGGGVGEGSVGGRSSSEAVAPILSMAIGRDNEEARQSSDSDSLRREVTGGGQLEDGRAAFQQHPSFQPQFPAMPEAATMAEAPQIFPSFPDPLPQTTGQLQPGTGEFATLLDLPLEQLPLEYMIGGAQQFTLDPPTDPSIASFPPPFMGFDPSAGIQTAVEGEQHHSLDPGLIAHGLAPPPSWTTGPVVQPRGSDMALESGLLAEGWEQTAGEDFNWQGWFDEFGLPETSTSATTATSSLPIPSSTFFDPSTSTIPLPPPSTAQQFFNPPHYPQPVAGPSSEPMESSPQEDLGANSSHAKGKGKAIDMSSAERRRILHRANQRNFRERRSKHVAELEKRLRELKEEKNVVSAEIESLRVENQRLLTRPPFELSPSGEPLHEHPETTGLYEDVTSLSPAIGALSLTDAGFGQEPSVTLLRPPQDRPSQLVSRNSEPIITIQTTDESPQEIRTTASTPGVPNTSPSAHIPLGVAPTLRIQDQTSTSYFDMTQIEGQERSDENDKDNE